MKINQKKSILKLKLMIIINKKIKLKKINFLALQKNLKIYLQILIKKMMMFQIIYSKIIKPQ